MKMNIKRRFQTVIFIVSVVPFTYVTLAYLARKQELTLFFDESTKSDIINGSFNSTTSITLRSSKENKTGEIKGDNSTVIFPRRSNKMIANRLQAAKEIMKPVTQELVNIRKVLLSSNYTWKKPGQISTVLDSRDHSFVATLAKSTLDILYHPMSTSQVRTISISCELTKLKRIFSSNFFMDYTTNNCQYVEAHAIYGHNMAKTMYNSSCHDSISKAWQPKSFQPSPFKEGLPQDLPQATDTLITIGYTHVVKNGVVDKRGDFAFGNVKVVIQRCRASKNKLISRPKQNHIFDEVFTIAQYWGVGFFHANVEDLTRIGPHLDFLRNNTSIKIHVAAKTGFMQNFMKHLGINPSRLVSGTVGARILYVPAGTTCGRGLIFPTFMLSLEFRNRISTQPEQRRSILLIKRTTKRRFQQHTKIFNMLQSLSTQRSDLGLKVEVYQDNPVPSLSKTLAMFNRAFIVIAPHGAGESNLIFSEPGTVMIEGLCGGKANYCYRNLALVLGHRYYGIYNKYSCHKATPEVIKAPVQEIINYFFQ